MADVRVVDTHHHFFPPELIARRQGEVRNVCGRATVRVNWTPEQSLAEMDRAGVAKAVLSISPPEVWLGDDSEPRRTARACNEYAASLTRSYPDRFAFFAAMPLPDVEGALAEVDYAFDRLGAAGVGLFTNYEDRYLGEQAFAPVIEALDRRKAVAFVHPRSCAYCQGPDIPLPPAYLELPFDTTRAAASLLFSRTLSRLRDVRFIFSHGGGALPMLTGRMELWVLANPELKEIFPQGLQQELQRHYFDTVSITSAPAMAALKTFAPPERLLFGTDYPVTSILPELEAIEGFGFAKAEHEAVIGGNAKKLLGL